MKISFLILFSILTLFGCSSSEKAEHPSMQKRKIVAETETIDSTKPSCAQLENCYMECKLKAPKPKDGKVDHNRYNHPSVTGYFLVKDCEDKCNKKVICPK